MQVGRSASLLTSVLIGLGLACSDDIKTAQKPDTAAPQDGPAPVTDGTGPESISPADAGADLPAPDLALGPDLRERDLTGNADTPGPDGEADFARDVAIDVGTDTGPADVIVDRGFFEDHPLLVIDSGKDGLAIDQRLALDGAAPDSPAQIPCDQLVSAYAAFLAAHRDCATVSDCQVVGGAGTCNCATVLGGGSGDAISASAVSDAQAYFNRAQACAQQGTGGTRVCDFAPAANLRCEAGQCKADARGCMDSRG